MKDHPTVQRYRERVGAAGALAAGPRRLDSDWLRRLCLDSGADDAGFVATYHFAFRGEETADATVVIRDKTIRVEPGHVGQADLRVEADSRTWLGFLAKERSIVWSLLRRKIRIKGSPKLLLAFGRCFPS